LYTRKRRGGRPPGGDARGAAGGNRKETWGAAGGGVPAPPGRPPPPPPHPPAPAARSGDGPGVLARLASAARLYGLGALVRTGLHRRLVYANLTLDWFFEFQHYWVEE